MSITYQPEMLPSPDDGVEADVIVDGKIVYSTDAEGSAMTEYMTPAEAAERERVVDAFMAHVALAETQGLINVSIGLKDAIEIRNELERLAEIETNYDLAVGAAEDRRWD